MIPKARGQAGDQVSGLLEDTEGPIEAGGQDSSTAQGLAAGEAEPRSQRIEVLFFKFFLSSFSSERTLSSE